MSQINVAHLQKSYRVHHKEPGLKGSLRAFVRRQYQDVRAVDDLSFTIDEGEVVGFLGPNGAGKTTTLKMLSGLLHPSGGQLQVLGYTPFERRNDFLRQITLVMGQKQQLIWDLPAIETFEVNRAIYEIPDDLYRKTVAELTELLNLEPLLTKQVRKLSLGERMKCELAAALLHSPRVLFLDEPTIGLDVTMQANVRKFIAEYNTRHRATVLLTSHYMADVTALCKRIIVIDRGKLLYDGDFQALVERVAPHKIVRIKLEQPIERSALEPYGTIDTLDGVEGSLLVGRDETSRVAARLLSDLPIVDVTIEEPPVEEIIGELFSGGALAKTNAEAPQLTVS
ncbi:MAG: ATP-binding cassette domain-containing protein [Chloroflexi bacterium]|nr:ATP-binding cassette domain-containing protein [Chloroflexota bacterium]